jgi:hypothetical protein
MLAARSSLSDCRTAKLRGPAKLLWTGFQHHPAIAARVHADGLTHSAQVTVRLGLSGVIASLVVAVPRVTHRVTGRFVRALGMNCLRVRGGAGLAPAAGLIRSLSALEA